MGASQFLLKAAKKGAKKIAKDAAEEATEKAAKKAEPLVRSQYSLHRDVPGLQGRKAEQPLEHGRISQRFPTAASRTEDPLQDNLLINIDAMDDPQLQRAADLISSYPNTTDAMREMKAPERVHALRDQMARNLLSIYDNMSPAARDRASLWYHGANRISRDRADEVGIHPNAAAGTYAALSPQKDWFQNVYLGDQVLRILDIDPKVDLSMLQNARDNPALQNAFGDPMMQEFLRSVGNRRLGDLTPEEQAIVLRLYDETHGPGRFNIITPEGDYGRVATTGGGDPAKPAWGAFNEVEKAIRSARSGGDPSAISPLMGERHKVRNFYNNIVAPFEGAPFGDITADTHQIAASLFRPLGSSADEVGQGLGKGSTVTGVHGLYPIYADATRLAAMQRSVPTIKMQSVPWEGVRQLFSPAFKRSTTKVDEVDDIWRAHGRGDITEDEARRRVAAKAGGYRDPAW